MFKRSCALLSLLISLAVLCRPAGLQTSSASPVEVIAHTKERIGDRIIASGDVEIHYGEIKLFADWIELNMETKDVLARGSVHIHLANEVISMEEVQLNLNSSQGELKKVHGMVQPSITYEAETVERENAALYHLKDAWITA